MPIGCLTTQWQPRFCLDKHHAYRVMKCETHNAHTGFGKTGREAGRWEEKRKNSDTWHAHVWTSILCWCRAFSKQVGRLMTFDVSSLLLLLFPFWLSRHESTIPENILFFSPMIPRSAWVCIKLSSVKHPSLNIQFQQGTHCFDGSDGGYTQIQHSKLPSISSKNEPYILFVRTGYSLAINANTLSGETCKLSRAKKKKQMEMMK